MRVLSVIRQISIHAPCTGSDGSTTTALATTFYFNPRSLHGERPQNWAAVTHSSAFQSTLPARGATGGHRDGAAARPYFNPRSLHGERRSGDSAPSRSPHFNPRSLHGERRESRGRHAKRAHFNPRSLHGERPRKVTILSIRIIGFAQKVYHKTVLLRISLAENAVILPEKPRNPVRTSLQRAGGLRFARAIRAARPYSISSPSGA